MGRKRHPASFPLVSSLSSFSDRQRNCWLSNWSDLTTNYYVQRTRTILDLFTAVLRVILKGWLWKVESPYVLSVVAQQIPVWPMGGVAVPSSRKSHHKHTPSRPMAVHWLNSDGMRWLLGQNRRELKWFASRVFLAVWYQTWLVLSVLRNERKNSMLMPHFYPYLT